ncbi:lysophospholipid acyltransferase family protein [Paracoccus fistulariae]|uniref:Lysophospholipid acyltransferase family protein n=1 Tax=Paracoccus fistulariae TaxID=658446 RepID=A0ABY7SKM8_9RHOB|nr:lysophospholipid acyltransferase family protein [Paracoccus fistulariae]MDB6181524.1 lysophospholipid acyltransferase family protein [Paracoccus fistulariae]WCR07558.1 lysophospholipid acyltransferase family protein [Paracoccus fistulariae]
MSQNDKPSLLDRIGNAAFLAVIRLAGLLPYDKRIPAVGWLFSSVLAPVAGWRGRVRDNLALARPDLGADEVKALTRQVPDNTGRSVAEIYSGDEFTRRIHEADPLEGPGLQALEEAFESQRPVIIACAHFGNYDAMRAALSGRGYPVGALYRPMNNEAFNRHYIPAITAIAEPLFPRGRAGLASMLRFLKGGGWLALGFDQYDRHSPELRFFDLPSRTVLTPAELALRYDALLIPVHGIRQPDGLSFRVHVGSPIPEGEPAEMMQALNDDLEMLVRQNMGQWFWVHRRWK